MKNNLAIADRLPVMEDTVKGLMVKIYLEKVSREPKTHIAVILNAEACPLQCFVDSTKKSHI